MSLTLINGLKQSLGFDGALAPLKAAGQLLTLHPLRAAGTLIKAPFNILGGALKAAIGVPLLPFQLIGSLFGGGSSPAARMGAQNAVGRYA
jgi:hypothetical protein